MEFFHQIWSQALTAVAGGEEVQSLMSRIQGLSKEEGPNLAERLAGQRKALERRMEELVGAAVSRLRVPRREELVQLNARLDALSDRLEGLSK